ncbi:MAG: hypothetical protein NTZ05_03750 [Chloroflexi bacterium]|nr:hypothetical protein [Chloroflexota bacterium]
MSRETTFAKDQEHQERLEAVLEELAAAVAAGLASGGRQGRTVTVKVRHHDFRWDPTPAFENAPTAKPNDIAPGH